MLTRVPFTPGQFRDLTLGQRNAVLDMLPKPKGKHAPTPEMEW